MSWWQSLLVFAGIPILVFVLITAVVWRFTTVRVPDGLLHAGVGEPAPDNNSEEDESDDRSRSADPADDHLSDAGEGSAPGPDDH